MCVCVCVCVCGHTGVIHVSEFHLVSFILSVFNLWKMPKLFFLFLIGINLRFPICFKSYQP